METTLPHSRPPTIPSRRSHVVDLDEAMRVLDKVARGVGRQLGDRYELDELKSFAHEALIEAMRAFDASRGVAFGAFARLRLRGAMLDAIRKHDDLPRGVRARARALRAGDLSLETTARHGARFDAIRADETLHAFLRGVATASATALVVDARGDDGEIEPHDPDDGPELAVQRAELRRAIVSALAAIGAHEAHILRRHYFDDLDLHEAAAELGLSKSWGSRLHARGISKLADLLREMKMELDS